MSLLIQMLQTPFFLIVIGSIRTDLVVVVAAFHHAKAEEKEVDPLEVRVLCDLRVCLGMRAVYFRRAWRMRQNAF